MDDKEFKEQVILNLIDMCVTFKFMLACLVLIMLGFCHIH